MKKVFNFYAKTGKKDKEGFNDALPIGNGRMGGMIYGHPVNEKIVLNADSLWLGKPGRKRYNKDFNKYYKEIQKLVDENKILEAEELIKLACFSSPKGECIYSTAGELRINFPFNENDVTNYKRILDLDDGLVNVQFNVLNNHIRRTHFASYKDQVIISNIKSDDKINFNLSLDREKIFDEIEIANDMLTLIYKYNNKDTLYIVLKVVSNGDVKNIGDNIIVTNSTDTTIYVSLDTTYNSKNIKKEMIDNINNLEYSSALYKHLDDYHSLILRQELKTNDNDINYFYELSRYLMISSSRINSLPANLQGIWNQDIFPSWDSKYTININLEMNYWNVYRSNLIECSLPYFELLKKIHKNGMLLAKNMYNARGFVAFHNSDMYGDCAPQDKYLPATSWPLGGAWMAIKIYEHYLYTNNLDFLNEYYYILKDSAIFFEDILIKDSDGYFVLSPSLSPENSYYLDDNICHVSKGCAMDTEILTDLFNAYIESSKVLNKKKDKKAIEIINNLLPLKVGSNGQIVEWNKDYLEAEKGHRHISQLYGLYPSDQITEMKPELFKAARRTIELRLLNGGGHTGWSKAWILCMYARLNDGKAFAKNFKEFISNSTSSIGLDLHPPFQIDGNFGVGSAISELLVREVNGYVELLPSINNTTLKDGYYNGIKLKGGFELSIKWNNYKLKELEIIGNGNIKIISKNSSFNIPDIIYVNGKYILN